MAIKIFLDTNIILDVFDNKRIFHSDSTAIYHLIEKGSIVAFVTESVVTTTDYVLQKLLQKGTRQMLFAELNNILHILPCRQQHFQTALQTNFDDLEDALLHQIALGNKVDYFVSNDKALNKKLSSLLLPVITSKGLMKMLG